MGMGQFKKRGNAKSPITAVITAVITAREYYREASIISSKKNLNIVLNVVYKLRVAHCGLCLCFHPPTMREQE